MLLLLIPEFTGSNWSLADSLMSMLRIYLVMEIWLLISRIRLVVAVFCDRYILETALTSGSKFSLLNDEMSLSTSPNSCSISFRRSSIKREVLTMIWFLSFSQLLL